MNWENLHELINRYEENIYTLNDSKNDEKFKWHAVQRFQDAWFAPDANRLPFSELFHKAIKGSSILVNNGTVQPANGVVKLAEKAPEEVERLFREVLFAERKEWTREQVLVNRFQMVFDEVKASCDPTEFARSYEDNLCIGHYFLPGAEEAVMALSKKYRLFLASNGTAKVQAGRLTSANLYRFFEKVYVSQELGANKPSIEFFERAFAQIPDFEKAKAIMVGDSLTSDIQGGIRAGIRTCWVNPEHLPGNPAIRPDYEIESIAQLETLLEGL